MGRLADDDFKAWFDWLLQGARKVGQQILDEGGSHVLMLQVHKVGDDEPMILAMPIAAPEMRDAAHRLQKMAATAGNVAGAVIISESWVVSGPIEDLPKIDMNASISERPDRKECLTLNAMRADMQLFAMIPIERDAAGKGSLGEPVIIDPNAPGEVLFGRVAQDQTKN